MNVTEIKKPVQSHTQISHQYDIKPWVACSCLRTLPFCILEAMSREKTWPPSLHVWESVQSFIEHRVVLSLGEFQRRQTRR